MSSISTVFKPLYPNSFWIKTLTFDSLGPTEVSCEGFSDDGSSGVPDPLESKSPQYV